MSACPSCRTVNPASERFCLACGASLASGPGEASCPSGHPIDPSWPSCPYCALLGAAPPQAARPTRLEEAPRPAPPLPPPGGAGAPSFVPPSPGPPRSGGARPTRLEAEALPAGRRTRLQGAGAPPEEPKELVRAPGPAARQPPPVPLEPPGGQPEPARELVAVLAAPGLSAGGAVFPVRLGKSFVGAHPSNDICLREDPQVSAEHALVLARNGRFYLSDRMSTNGTWVNGEEVGAGDQVELRNHDRVRCGTTELVLLVLPPAAGPTRRRTE